MKKIWLAVVGVVLVLAVVGMTGCNGDGGVTLAGGDGELKLSLNSQQDGIWVSGTGMVYAEPDIAILRLGIEVMKETVTEAQAEAQVAMNDVVEALKAQGIEEKDIQTQYFTIQRITDWDKYYEEREGVEYLIGYKVTNIVSAKIRDVDKAGEVIDAVAIAGGDLTRIDSINFTIDEPSEYYAQAREEAIDYAKAKAEQMAELAGVKLGQVTYITENSYMSSPNYYSRDAVVAESAAGVSTSISTGEMEISTSVQMAFSISD
jgi:uncharacterized protein YggE